MAQSGFMLYVDDWINWTADYSDEETGIMLKALLNFFTTGEVKEFADRGMRQFFRQAIKAIELDRKRYDDKCLHNAHNRYKGECKKKGIEALDFEEWLTTVDNRQGTLPITTNTNTNNQESIININNQLSVPNISTKGSAEGNPKLEWIKALNEEKYELADSIRKQHGF